MQSLRLQLPLKEVAFSVSLDIPSLDPFGWELPHSFTVTRNCLVVGHIAVLRVGWRHCSAEVETVFADCLHLVMQIAIELAYHLGQLISLLACLAKHPGDWVQFPRVTPLFVASSRPQRLWSFCLTLNRLSGAVRSIAFKVNHRGRLVNCLIVNSDCVLSGLVLLFGLLAIHVNENVGQSRLGENIPQVTMSFVLLRTELSVQMSQLQLGRIAVLIHPVAGVRKVVRRHSRVASVRHVPL